jgi:hypothetical protein
VTPAAYRKLEQARSTRALIFGSQFERVRINSIAGEVLLAKRKQFGQFYLLISRVGRVEILPL